MVSCVRFLLGGRAAIVTLVATMVSICANMARTLTLHWIVRAVCVQVNADFRALSSHGVVDLNWLCMCRPGWKVNTSSASATISDGETHSI